MKLVTAIVRTTSLERVVRHLEKIGVRGATILEVKGIGEQMQLNSPYTIHDRIDLYVADEKVDDVVDAIRDHAATGLAGDGLVAVSSVNDVIRIRNGERVP